MKTNAAGPLPVPELQGKRVFPLFPPEEDRRTRERLKKLMIQTETIIDEKIRRK